MQTSAFEVYALGLLAVLERVPIPIAVALDRNCERVQGNSAFRAMTGLSISDNASLTVPEYRRTNRFAFYADGAPIDIEGLPMRRAAHAGIDVLDMPVRLVRRDGIERDVVISAWPLTDFNGNIEGAISVFVDVTERHEAEKRAEQALHALTESERRYRLITEAMPEFVWLDSPDGSAIYSNRRWLEYTGLSEEENKGLGWEQVVHPDDKARLRSERDRTLKTGDPYEGECRYRGKDGKYRWFLFRSIAVRDESGQITSWLGTATDIDKQKRAEAQQAFFALASDVLSSTLDVGSTLERIARLAIDSLGTWCQIDLPDADGRLRVAVAAHQDPVKNRRLSRLVDHHIYAEGVAFGVPNVFATGHCELLATIDEANVKAVIPDETTRALYREIGYAAGIIVPLRTGNRILGVLGIATDDTTRLYTEFDVATAAELGRRGAAALENAQSYAREHRVATTLQRALLPSSLPSGPHVSFDSAYASEAFEKGEAVGGDWYDAFAIDDRCIAISMGDVAGHGVDAAVTMSTVRQAIRTAAIGGTSPAAVLARANAIVLMERRVPMVTALYGVYDTQTRAFTYVLAGHPRPLLVDDSGTCRVLPGAGPPLGDVFDETLCDEQTQHLSAPCTLIFYTDGLIEFRRNVIDGIARLQRVVGERYFLADQHPAQAIIEHVLDAPQRDDIAVLVMRVDDPSAERLHVVMPARGRSAPVLRERLRQFALAHGVDEERAFRVLNATGEAVANAIEHAYGGKDGNVVLDARLNGEKLLIEVHDYGRWRESHDASGLRGRGQAIMRSLVDRMDVERTPHGTTVRLEL